MVHDSKGYMLGLLGDVTSTVSSCHISGVCATWEIYVHNLHASCRPIAHMTSVKSSLIFCACWGFVFVSCTNLTPCGISILILHISIP